MNLCKISIAWLTGLLYTQMLSAQYIPPTYLGIEQGLSNNNVTKIFQDHEGFMWIGTYDGLNRYDGYDFGVYKNHPDQENSLPDNRITDIAQDPSGKLWVATKVGAAALRKGSSTFKRIAIEQATQEVEAIDFAINQIALGKHNNVFLGSERAGLLLVKTESDQSILAAPIPLRTNNGQIHQYNVQGLASDMDHKIWLFVQGYGLCYYNPKDNSVHVKDTRIYSATNLVSSPDGGMWISTEHGVYRYDVHKNHYQLYSMKNGLPNHNVLGMSYHDGQMWIYSDGGGITQIDSKGGAIRQFPVDKGMFQIKNQSISAVYKDRQKRIWVGSLRGGLNIIDPRHGKFKHLTYSNASDTKGRDYVLSFAEGSNRQVWIGTDGDGLVRWDMETGQFVPYPKNQGIETSLNNGFVTSIIEYNGSVWAATYGGGVNRLDMSSGKFKTYYCNNPHTGYNSLNVWKIFRDSRDRIWACTLNGGGTYLYDPAHDMFCLANTSIYDALAIHEESPNIFWFGSWATLSRLDMRTGKTQTFNVGKPVRAIHADGKKLWLATEGGGLLHFDKATGTFDRYTETEGLPSNTLLNILPDDAGHLWISSYNGLSKFNPRNRTFQNYRSSDGLQSNQFSYNAALKLRSGELLFGGIRGFNIFDPSCLEQTAVQPPVVITSFHIGNVPMDRYQIAQGSSITTDSLTIAYDDAAFSFAFAALEYSFPDKIAYAYYLEGWDKDWNYVKNQRTAHYSGLREGNYTLRIRSTDANGLWSDQERTMQIHILPPWWRTNWAYAAYFLIIGSILYSIRRYERQQTSLKYKVELAEMQARQEHALNEKKIAFFTHIAHEFRNPLTLIVNPLRDMALDQKTDIDRHELRHVYHNSRRLLNLVDKLLYFRQAENTFDKLRLVRLDIVHLCHEVYHCFQQHAALRKINYTFVSELEDFTILADREKIEICLFNLISNAIKFTPVGGTVEVSLEHHASILRLQIKDTGCGISSDLGDSVYEVFNRDYSTSGSHKEGFGIGLYLVKKFVDAHQGTVHYQKNRPTGTVFGIDLLCGEEHFTDVIIHEDVAEHSTFIEDLMREVSPLPAETPIDSPAEIPQHASESPALPKMVSDQKRMLIVDDNPEIRNYLTKVFREEFEVSQAASAEEALAQMEQTEPDIILSDIVMDALSGIEFCSSIKNNPLYNHIPIILLTASSSQDVKLKGLESGADDYVTKPFDKDILVARVNNLIKSRNRLQDYFYKEITLQHHESKISSEYKEFLEKAMTVVEEHLLDDQFTVKHLADKMGMSHSNMYKRIKSISGKSANEFIRFIRLRKAAQFLIDTDRNINEAAVAAGFNDIKYFRTQFTKLFGMKPSEYKKKYRPLNQKHHVNMR